MKRALQASSTPLARALSAEIAAVGPMRLDRFMERVLQDPEHGYYRRARPLGREGDFITAPEISQIFGELVGLWLADRWMAAGRPVPARLVELGPGRGTLMADALRAMAVVPELHRVLEVHLVESHPELRREQAGRVPEARWHDRFDDVPSGPLLLVANEFFDALPIRQFRRETTGWSECHIGLDEEGGDFRFVFRPVPARTLEDLFPANRLAGIAPGGIIEANEAARAIMTAIARRLAEEGGAALIIDYGYAAPGHGNTLQAVRRHAPVPLFEAPGEADWTAHVDFTALAAAAGAQGARVFGPLAQGLFLEALGIGLRAERLAAGKEERTRAEIMSGVARLVAGDAMGALFQVLAILGPQTAEPPPGFFVPPSGGGG